MKNVLRVIIMLGALLLANGARAGDFSYPWGLQGSHGVLITAPPKPAGQTTLEQTVAYILNGGVIELSQMTTNPDGSVHLPTYSSGLAFIQIPAATVRAIDPKECVIEQKSEPVPGFRPTSTTVVVYFNRITGFSEQTLQLPGFGTGIAFKVQSEEPIICTDAKVDVGGMPFPSSCMMNTNGNLFNAIKPEKVEKMRNAINYLYTNFCSYAKNKNAF